MDNIWQLQDAKNKFSNLVKKAQQLGPQIITKRGIESVVVLSIKDYRRLIKPKSDLVTFFQRSPLASEKLDLKRRKDISRDIEL